MSVPCGVYSLMSTRIMGNSWSYHFSGPCTILFAEVLYSRLELGIGLRRCHGRDGTEPS